MLPHQIGINGRSIRHQRIMRNARKKDSDKATPGPKEKGSDEMSEPTCKGLDVWQHKTYTAVITFDKTLTGTKPKTFPFHTGSFTVYNDRINKIWRIRAYPGSRHTFNIKHAEQWTAVVQKIKQLHRESA